MRLSNRFAQSGTMSAERFLGGFIVRFLQPDMRDLLYESADITQTPLFEEFRQRVLVGLNCDDTVIVNLGLIEPFPTVFYRFLLKVREAVQAQGARLILCRLSDEHKKIFEITKGFRIFAIVHSERQAIYEAGLAAPMLVNGNSTLL